MTPETRHRAIVRKFGGSRTAPTDPTTAPHIQRRSVQTLARTTPLDDQTPQESGAHEGSRASQSPRAPRARAFDLVRARMRHRFTSAKPPHGERAARLAGAPNNHRSHLHRVPHVASRDRAPHESRAQESQVSTRAAPQSPEAPRAEHRRRTERRGRMTSTNPRDARPSSHTTAPPDRGTADIHDTYPQRHFARVLRNNRTVTPCVSRKQKNTAGKAQFFTLNSYESLAVASSRGTL